MDSIAGMRLLTRIVEEGSFAGAARYFNLTPSAVSRQLSDFEHDLCVRLFQRTTRKMTLTEPGELLYAKASQIVAEVEQVRTELTLLGNTPSGALRVTAPAAFGRRHIAPLLPAFFDKYSKIEVGLSLNDVFQDVIGEGYDIAIRQWEPADTSLRASHLADIELIMCASPDYLQQHGQPQTIGELKQHNCLTFRSQAGANRWQFYNKPDVIEAIEARGNFYSNDIDALLSAALSGLGVIRSANWLVDEYLRDGSLVRVLSAYPTHPQQKGIYALYSGPRLLSPKSRVFIDFLKEKYRAMSWNQIVRTE